MKNGEYEPAENFEAIYGRYFSPFFALEGGFHHFRAKSDVIRTIRIEQFMIANGIVLTPKFLYPGERFELYAGIGIGRYLVTNETWFHGPFSTDRTDTKDTITGYHVLVGASYDLSRKWFLGVEGRQVKLLDFMGETDITGRSVSAVIGLRF